MSGSSGAAITVLVVDGGERGQDRVATRIRDVEPSMAVESVGSADAALAALDAGEFDCLVSRYRLPDGTGLDLLEAVREVDRFLPFVLFAEEGDEHVASEAISLDVSEYVHGSGPDRYARLADRIEAAVADHRTEQSLRESEQRYRTLVEGSHDGIYIYRDDQFRFVNDRACEITGYDRERLYEMSIWDLLHPDDRERVREIGRKRRNGEDAPNTYDARVVTADGETRYLQFSVQSTTYRGEWAALGSVRDVTERRRREEQFREEHEFVETLLDTLDDVIFVATLDGDLVRWNDRLHDVTGYDDSELAETNVFELLRGDYEAVSADVVRERVESRSGGLEVEVETADGETIPFEFRGSTLTGEDGDVTRIAGVARDVTEQRERERELAQYRTIIEAVGDPVYTLGADGRITLVNDALEEITGYDESELLGEHVSILMREEDVTTARSLIEELLKSEERRNGTFEMEAVTKAGDRIPCEDHMALLPGPEAFNGTAGVVRDISERKERERTLRRQNERLDQFASVVSHDLRNPLNVIVGRLEAARETGADEHFDAIERSARRMERLIDDLLTLARDGQRVGEVEPVSVDAVVDRAWGTVETAAARLVVEDDLGVVAADGDRLPSLFENLFRNSVEHGGDEVTVRVGRIDTDETTGFFVADTGTGFQHDEYDRVFDHGYTTATDGTGLGLVIVEGIVEAHGWSIDATESREGGARFEITDVSRPA